jgi:cytoskeletal protein CcmA (bactofilin family)
MKVMWEKEQKIEITTILGKGAEFIGKLIFTGSVCIDGDFQGEINLQGSLVVGEGALVKANIAVKSIHISGEIQGKIEAKEKIIIHSTGKFFGDIHTPVLIMAEGAFFDGNSHMAEAVENKTNVHQVD